MLKDQVSDLTKGTNRSVQCLCMFFLSSLNICVCVYLCIFFSYFVASHYAS